MKRLLHHPALKGHGPQILMFLTCGVTGAMVEFAILILLVEVFHVRLQVAFLPPKLIASVYVFLFNKYLTFGGRPSGGLGEKFRFVLVYGSALIINYFFAVSFFWLGNRILAGTFLFDWVYLLANAGAIGITAVWNYLFLHFFVFKKSKDHGVVSSL